ncbi:periplasmic peptidase family S9 [Alishewanella longhuensis]|uniref:Periplasmic peptidase family S9 n=1 Tax=Alishewanella longhuensis TaxID=1091037 RepID=A0ABQ3KZU0_9ALTE|nr:prolyl oligopeptidase family serine peptidase [Alishewanella longhuensis]GHG70552.1 periplasmic peptidase family S9 [Alishewanella longhuensis]
MKTLVKHSSQLALCMALAFGTFACSQLSFVKTPLPTPVVITASATDTSQLAPLALIDVMQFREIKGRSLSKNQQWLIYTAEPDYGDSTGYVQHLLSEKSYAVANADRGLLNQNGHFALFRQQAPLLAREQAKDDKAAREALAHDAVLLNTQTGVQTLFSQIDKFAFSGDGQFAFLLSRKKDSKDKTQLLQVLDLHTLSLTELGQVTDFVVAPEGDLLAFVSVVSSEPSVKASSAKAKDTRAKSSSTQDNNTPANGTIEKAADQQQVTLYAAGSKNSRVFNAASAGEIQHLVFSEDGQQLLFLAGDKAEKNRETAQQLWYWSVQHATANPLVINQDGWILSAGEAPRFSADGQRIFLGLRPEPVVPTTALAAPQSEDALFDTERLLTDRKLQVWHGQDDRINSQQKAEYQASLKRTAPAVFWLAEQRLVVLSTDIEDRLYRSEHSEAALISNGRPHFKQLTWQGRLHDIWHVNLKTGQRQQVFAANPSFERAHLSPSGRFVLYQQQGKLWLFDSSNGQRQQLAADVKVSWVDETHDRPEPASSYGIAGWLADESAVLVYDRFAIWRIALDGTSQNLTPDSRSATLQLRMVQTDPKALALDPQAPLLLRGFNEENKSTGFYQLDLADNRFSTLLSGEKRYDVVDVLSELAEATPHYLFTEQSFRQFPDLWLANSDFSQRSQLTEINPQQVQFIWGDSHLIDWYTADGSRLQGVVITPDGYDATKRYPVLVYYYEQFSDRLYNFNQMKVNHRPNFPFYLGQDYVVFLPDIRFREGAPGPSATESLLPGIDRLIELGIADPKAIGLHGHSWSGYQTAFVVTETDRFAAAVAGAPVSNMTSAYSGIRWQTGLARQFQYETGQSRIGPSMFENLAPYIENSPVFFANRINTPLVIQFGDKDGAVPWEQGIELYLAMRRLNKDVVMLHYEGEDHHLAHFANKLDYSIKMLEFFNHYLKGEPAPAWWQQGQPYQPNN